MNLAALGDFTQHSECNIKWCRTHRKAALATYSTLFQSILNDSALCDCAQVLLYSFAGTCTALALGHRLVGLNMGQIRREADLRYSLVRIRCVVHICTIHMCTCALSA